MNNVIISGADGFIGSHLAKFLTQKGYNVYALVMPHSTTISRINCIDKVNIIECDLLNISNIEEKLHFETLAFFHFAWIGVSPEQRNEIDIQKKNIDLTLNAIKVATITKAKKFIFPGSTFEYCFSNEIINRYAHPCPQDIYGSTKIATKLYAQLLCRDNDIDFIYTVISGIYSEDRLDNNVITYTIRSLLKGEIPLLTRLEQKWDYVHIDDVILAFYCILENGKNEAFYVIGQGDNCPLSDYIYKIRDLINPNLELGIGAVPYKNNIIPMSCVDLTEIEKDTGYKPQIPFDEGIKKVIGRIKETEGF